VSAQVKLRELAERGRAASPTAVTTAPAQPHTPASWSKCGACGSPRDELIAREPWPARMEVERCGNCRAVTSYLHELSHEGGVRVVERRKIERTR
jgi:hypothetical protein